MDDATREIVGGGVAGRAARPRRHQSWLRRHALLIGVAIIGAASMAQFTWAEWGYFRDQNANVNTILVALHARPQPTPGFWSREHVHDWAYNAASNWQSECLFGILLLVVLLKLEGPEGADREDT